jgi:hypothetical protein
MALDWPKALRILALKEALSDDQSYDFFLRKVFRWYSKTFSTPLHLVPTLPTFDVLQAYYEEGYCNMVENKDAHEFHEELSHLSKTEDELAKEREQKDLEEVAIKRTEAGMIASNKKLSKDSADAKLRQLQAKLERDRKVAKELEGILSKDPLGLKAEPEAPKLASIPQAPPQEFNMSFTGLDEIGDLDGLASLAGLGK